MSRFQQYIPAALLRPYIRYFAIAENDHAQTYKVLPDISLVMGLQYRGSLSQMLNHTPDPLSAFGITGLQESVRLFQSTENTGTLLICFTPAGASAFFRHPVHELFGQSLSMDHFISQSLLHDTLEQLSATTTDNQKLHIIEQFLLSQLRADATSGKILSPLFLLFFPLKAASMIAISASVTLQRTLPIGTKT